LIPEVGCGIDDPVRERSLQAVRRLVEEDPDLVVVIGAGPASASYGPADSGSLAGYGVDLTVPLGPRMCGGEAILPLSLTIGAWLLRQTGWTGDRQAYAVPDRLEAGEADALGRTLAELDDRVALLCMGDGSARRTEKAPGWLDQRAEPFDRSVAAALRQGDPAALHELDDGLARELLAAGRASWQVLAGAAAERRWHGRLDYDEAPFGVAYFVAGWTPAVP
jgi:hypothetical protein